VTEVRVRFGKAGLLGVLATAGPVHAQTADRLHISGTVRLRYEAISGQARTGFNTDDDLVNLRTTLMAEYRSGPFTIAGELWDSRVYSDRVGTPISTGEVNALEPVQVYAAYAVPLAEGGHATVQAGRFLLNIGARRLVAADDYRNTTSGYTGLHVDVKTRLISASFIYVLPQQRRPDDVASVRSNDVSFDHEGFDQVLWGGTVMRAKAIGPLAAEVSFYHLGERDTRSLPTRDRSLHTYGGRLLRAPTLAKIDVEIESFYQSGRISASLNPNAARVPVSAWFVHADAGYTFPGTWRLRASIEYDRASGDRSGGRYGRFDTLFGQRRPTSRQPASITR
jgi:hypothetical protein